VKQATRAVVVSLKYLTAAKRCRLDALVEAYRGAVNHFIAVLWTTPGQLDKDTLTRVSCGRLSARYKSQALKQALEVVNSTQKAIKATGQKSSLPRYTGGATLDAKFVDVEEGRGSFDLVVRISSLEKGERITIPTKHTAMTRKWLVTGGTWVQGASISEERLVLWIKLPSTAYKSGPALGVDLGINKLLTTSDAKLYGIEFKKVSAKIRRRQPDSASRQRAFRERDNYINQVTNQLPWNTIGVLGVEDLKNLKRGKGKRSKAFRKALSPWTYRRVLDRLGCKAQENRVRLVAVRAAYTSQRCPSCGAVNRLNRKGEVFLCVACGYSADADVVGAQNVLARTLQILGSVESPKHKSYR
jgi:IS605 OrfB family transposase